MAFIKISALPESTTTTDLALAGVETGITVKMSNSIGSAQVVTALGFTPAPLASPTFTDTPAAPTPTAGDNTTKLATTAFVQGAITGIGGAAAWGHITGTLAAQTDLATALALKAPLASPALTGTPTAPTAMLADNSTTIATTAFLKGQGYQPGIQFKDEGVNIGTLGGETIVNFTGAGVTGVESTGTITINIPGGGASSGLQLFNVKDHGAVGNGSTDDTVSIQNTIDTAAAAGGGIVYFPTGIYIVGGPLQDVAYSNCQLKLPTLAAPATSSIVVIYLLGAIAPSMTCSVYGLSGSLPSGGSIIKGTLNVGVGGALLGGNGSPGFAPCLGGIQNLMFQMPSNPVLTAINFEWLEAAKLQNVAVNAGFYDASSTVQPTTMSSYGIKLPGNNNGAYTQIDSCLVIGFYTGLKAGEHTDLDNFQSWACIYGAEIPAGYHATYWGRFMTVDCANGLRFTGGDSYISIKQFDIEYLTTGWYANTSNVYDPSNFGHGDITWHSVLAGSGASNTFVITGGANLRYQQIDGLPIAYGISGSNPQTGTMYTLAVSDASKIVSMSNASANTLTVPLNSSVPLPVNVVVYIQQKGLGQTTITASVGVTINSASTYNTRAQYSVLGIVQSSLNVWELYGDFA